MFCAPDRTCWSRPIRDLAWIGMGLLVFGLALTRPVHAQTVRATVSADSVHVGEPFILSLVATHRSASPAMFPPAGSDAGVFGDVETLNRTSVATRYPGNDRDVRIDSVAYEATTFALDTARVPALPAWFVAGTDTVRAASTPFILPVRSTVPPDAEGLRGLAPLATFPRSRWPWALIAVAALVLIAGLVYYWRRRRAAATDAPSSPAPPSLPPYKAARQRLQALEETTEWEDSEAPEYVFVELSTTARTYVAARLEIAALERTTHELIDALHAKPSLPASAIDALQDVLEQADLVKFADRRLTSNDARAALRNTRTALDEIEQALEMRAASSSPRSSVDAGTKSTSNR